MQKIDSLILIKLENQIKTIFTWNQNWKVQFKKIFGLNGCDPFNFNIKKKCSMHWYIFKIHPPLPFFSSKVSFQFFESWFNLSIENFATNKVEGVVDLYTNSNLNIQGGPRRKSMVLNMTKEIIHFLFENVDFLVNRKVLRKKCQGSKL